MRNFSRITIHANNYYPKKIYVFQSVTIKFLNNKNSSLITYKHQHDDQFEMARPIMIDLKHHIASKIKIRFYFHGNWLLISEITFDSFIVPTNINTMLQQPTKSKQTKAIHFSIYIIICISIIIIILLFLMIAYIIGHLFNININDTKHYFIPNHNHTDSLASTTSSDIDIGSFQHRYATIGTIHPYITCTNGTISTEHCTKLVSTSSLLQSSSIIQQHHIEGICGNSSYGCERLLNFNLKQNQFIPTHKINIKQRIENRHQIRSGGEVNVRNTDDQRIENKS